MEHWDLRTLEVEPHQPKILHSARGEARSILINLPAGEELQEHQVHERAYVVVIDGEVELGGPAPAAPGLAAVFDPNERHAVKAISDARLLIVLAPWPGDGHPGARDLLVSLKCSERRTRLGGRRRRAGRVQQVLDAVDARDLAGVLAEALDPVLVGTSPRR